MIKSKIHTVPEGFGVNEVSKWLKDIPIISSFVEVEPFFHEKIFSYEEWFALTIIIRNKYINAVSPNKEFTPCYEHYINSNSLSKEYLDLHIQEDKSRILDFSCFKHLKKLVISSCRTCESIILPINLNLELIEIFNMPKLKRIENLESAETIKHLAIRKCNKLEDFSSIKSLKQLLVLDISLNKNLIDLDFLEKNNTLRILQLIDTSVAKLENISDILTRLKNLKVLNLKANQLELKQFRCVLPDCFVNGINKINTSVSNNSNGR